MPIYQYTKDGNPCVKKIREDVELSDIPAAVVNIYDANRTIDPQTRACNSCTFKIEMSKELSSEDKEILDGIVDTSIEKHLTHKTKKWFYNRLAEIENTEQKVRILAAIDKEGFNALLDSYDFVTAKALADQALSSSAINQADCDLIKSLIPDSKWRTE